MEIFENELPEGFYILGHDPYKGETTLGSIHVYQRDSEGNKEAYTTMEKLYPVLINTFDALKSKYFIFDRDYFKEGDTITMDYGLGSRYRVLSQPISLEDMFIYKVDLKEGDRKEDLLPGTFFDSIIEYK